MPNIASYYLNNKYLLLSAVLTEFKLIAEIKIGKSLFT